jgi:hypothetical protein
LNPRPLLRLGNELSDHGWAFEKKWELAPIRV